jgi:large subunit ribosomal protein L32
VAVPKRKMSRANTRSRRAQWKATSVALVPVQTPQGSARVPRRLVRAVQRGLIDVTPYLTGRHR